MYPSSNPWLLILVAICKIVDWWVLFPGFGYPWFPWQMAWPTNPKLQYLKTRETQSIGIWQPQNETINYIRHYIFKSTLKEDRWVLSPIWMGSRPKVLVFDDLQNETQRWVNCIKLSSLFWGFQAPSLGINCCREFFVERPEQSL